MEAASFLGVEPGLTAIIGGGGKTTLMYMLAEELKPGGRVIICTSTRIFKPGNIPVYSGNDEAALEKELLRSSVICVGAVCEDGKLKAPDCTFERLMLLAPYVLVEADGSQGLPMKAHAPWEPVIPDSAGTTVLVIGASGFGRTISSAAHRPELFAKLAGAEVDDILTPDHAARVAATEGFHDCVFVNQAETEDSLAAAKSMQTILDCPVIAGSLHLREYIRFSSN